MARWKYVVWVYSPRHPLSDIALGDDLSHFGRRVPGRVEAGNNRSHRGPRYVVDRDPVLFECLQHTDVVETFGATATHYHTDALCPRRCGKQQCGCKKEEKSAFDMSVHGLCGCYWGRMGRNSGTVFSRHPGCLVAKGGKGVFQRKNLRLIPIYTRIFINFAY